jgi:hypothetical protein
MSTSLASTSTSTSNVDAPLDRSATVTGNVVICTYSKCNFFIERRAARETVKRMDV